MSPQVCIFWLVVVVTAKLVFSLLPWQRSFRVKNPYSSTQNQNIKLINSPSFKSNRSLFLEIKVYKWSFPHWLRALGIVIVAKGFRSDKNIKFWFCSIILHKNFFHVVFDWVLIIFPYFLKLCWEPL